jgi:hypothetical protein
MHEIPKIQRMLPRRLNDRHSPLFHRGGIVLLQSRNQVERRFAKHAPCLIGMETCVSENALGQDARLMLIMPN